MGTLAGHPGSLSSVYMMGMCTLCCSSGLGMPLRIRRNEPPPQWAKEELLEAAQIAEAERRMNTRVSLLLQKNAKLLDEAIDVLTLLCLRPVKYRKWARRQLKQLRRMRCGPVDI